MASGPRPAKVNAGQTSGKPSAQHRCPAALGFLRVFQGPRPPPRDCAPHWASGCTHCAPRGGNQWGKQRCLLTRQFGGPRPRSVEHFGVSQQFWWEGPQNLGFRRSSVTHIQDALICRVIVIPELRSSEDTSQIVPCAFSKPERVQQCERQC